MDNNRLQCKKCRSWEFRIDTKGNEVCVKCGHIIKYADDSIDRLYEDYKKVLDEADKRSKEENLKKRRKTSTANMWHRYRGKIMPAIYLLIMCVGIIAGFAMKEKRRVALTEKASIVASKTDLVSTEKIGNNMEEMADDSSVTLEKESPYPVINVAALESNVLSVEQNTENSTEINGTDIAVFSGNISIEDQCDDYPFVAPCSGLYRAEISGMMNETGVGLYLCDETGANMGSDNYCTNEEGITVKDLEAGHSYTVKVKQNHGLSAYTLNIGIPKPISDISGYTAITDSMEFTDQRNLYTFRTFTDGGYRFDFSGIQNGTYLEFYLFNDMNETVVSDTWCENGDGVTAKDLSAGQTYHIQVRQGDGFSSYIMNIGYPKDIVDISRYSELQDSIKFEDQRNLYTFTAPINGVYRFELSGMQNGTHVELYLFNDLMETVTSNIFCENGDGITAKELEAGKEYQLQVRQGSGYSNYALSIGKQKETVRVSKGCIVNDRIEYEDQVNRYSLTSEGSDSLNITASGMESNMNIELYVLNDLDEKIASNVSLENGDSISVTNLPMGQCEIRVRQSKGEGAYSLNFE